MDSINPFDYFQDVLCAAPADNEKSAPLPSLNLTTEHLPPTNSPISVFKTPNSDSVKKNDDTKEISGYGTTGTDGMADATLSKSMDPALLPQSQKNGEEQPTFNLTATVGNAASLDTPVVAPGNTNVNWSGMNSEQDIIPLNAERETVPRMTSIAPPMRIMNQESLLELEEKHAKIHSNKGSERTQATNVRIIPLMNVQLGTNKTARDASSQEHHFSEQGTETAEVTTGKDLEDIFGSVASKSGQEDGSAPVEIGAVEKVTTNNLDGVLASVADGPPPDPPSAYPDSCSLEHPNHDIDELFCSVRPLPPDTAPPVLNDDSAFLYDVPESLPSARGTQGDFGDIFDSPQFQASNNNSTSTHASEDAQVTDIVRIASDTQDPFGIFRERSAPSQHVKDKNDGNESTEELIAEDTPAQIDQDGLPPSAELAVASTEKVSPSVEPNEPPQAVTEELPSDGKVYDTQIGSATLGVMFFTPEELSDSLFVETDKDLLGALGKRPVVGFMVNASVARNVGVKLGHVLLAVDGIEVKTPAEARKAVIHGPRPLNLKFYVPNTTVTCAEGMHMVKYDERTKLAPLNITDWKAKYVVVGGIIAQAWHINMYRSRAEYETAVIETLGERSITVKVKHFGLYSGAFIHTDSIKTVKYDSSLKHWNYFVLKSPDHFPVKIASTNLEDLNPVYDAIRRVLAARAQLKEHGLRKIKEGRKNHNKNDCDEQEYDNRCTGSKEAAEF